MTTLAALEWALTASVAAGAVVVWIKCSKK